MTVDQWSAFLQVRQELLFLELAVEVAWVLNATGRGWLTGELVSLLKVTPDDIGDAFDPHYD